MTFSPRLIADIWRLSLTGARQPARRDFELAHGPADARSSGVGAIRDREQSIHPMAWLKRFDRPGAGDRDVLIIPPMSGGFAFVTRDMVARLTPASHVWVVDWVNARHALAAAATFGLDDQIDVVARALSAIRREADEGAAPRPLHAIGICQSGGPTLAAATLATLRDGAAPTSVTALGAPLDPDTATSPVSAAIRARGLDGFKRLTIERRSQRGAVARVYPAESHLALLVAILSRNDPSRDEITRIAQEEPDSPLGGPAFLDVVGAMMDLPARLFLESLERHYFAAPGSFGFGRWRGRDLPPEALGRTALLSIEGRRDHVAAPGQTSSALARFPAIGGALRRRLIIEGAGHFGLFHGARWRREVAPQLIATLRAAEKRARESQSATSSTAVAAGTTGYEATG